MNRAESARVVLIGCDEYFEACLKMMMDQSFLIVNVHLPYLAAPQVDALVYAGICLQYHPSRVKLVPWRL